MDLPALPEHERLDLRMRQAVRQIGTAWLGLVEDARVFLDGSYWYKWGYTRPEEYFLDHLGLTYRTVRRWLTVLEGLRRLPPPDYEPAKDALLELGAHKAAVLAPVLGREGEDWRAWTAHAAEWTEARLQEAVSERCGHRPRGAPSAPGERWYRALLSDLPDELQDLTGRAFRLAEQQLGPGTAHHPMACWAAICQEFVGTYETRADNMGERP